MKCWIERMCKAEERGEAKVMLCADTCLQNQLKNRGQQNTEVMWWERWPFSDAFFTTMVTCAYTVASRLLFLCVCVWRACLVSLHWEAAVECITSDFLFQLVGLAVSALFLFFTHEPSPCFLGVVQKLMEPRLVQRFAILYFQGSRVRPIWSNPNIWACATSRKKKKS